MKGIIFTALLCTFLATTAYADWQTDFQTTYQEEGIQPAVTKALAEGASPEAIINEALTSKGMATQGMISALYCSGADGNDIKKASDAAGIATSILVAAYEKSVDECGDTVQKTATFAAEETGLNFTGFPSPTYSSIGRERTRTTYASPSKPSN